MLADQLVDAPDMVHWAAVYDADVVRLRALGCRCLLRCEVDGRRLRAVPLHEADAATCPIDHEGS